MSRPPPQPIFVHHGFTGGVTSCAVISTENSKGILVGSGAGKCDLYDAETHLLIRTIYELQVLLMGLCELFIVPLENTLELVLVEPMKMEEQMLWKNKLLSDSNAMISPVDNGDCTDTGTRVGSLPPSEHTGRIECFIEFLAEDCEKRSISAVGEYDGVVWVHIRNHGVLILGSGGEVQKTLKLGHCGYCRAIIVADILVYPDNENEEHYLRLAGMTSRERGRIALRQLPLSLISIDNYIFVGDEAGSVMKFSLEGNEEAQVSLFSEPVFSLAGTLTTIACGSSRPPLLLLETTNICAERRKIDYPSSARGVGAMVFSSTGKTLVAGFWDGSIRAYSVHKLAILVYLNLHTETITHLLWCEVGADDLLIAASQDEKLSLWKLK